MIIQLIFLQCNFFSTLSKSPVLSKFNFQDAARASLQLIWNKSPTGLKPSTIEPKLGWTRPYNRRSKMYFLEIFRLGKNLEQIGTKHDWPKIFFMIQCLLWRTLLSTNKNSLWFFTITEKKFEGEKSQYCLFCHKNVKRTFFTLNS